MKEKKCDSCGNFIDGVYYEVVADRRIRQSTERWSVCLYAVLCTDCYLDKLETISPEDKR